MSRITIATKKTGDRLTATEFNAVVDAVNDNADTATVILNDNANIKKVNEAIQRTQYAQQSDINTLKANMEKMVYLTQEAYDALVTAGTVDADTCYNILEE